MSDDHNGGDSAVERVPEFVREACAWGATARCEDCGYSVSFDGGESTDRARKLWWSEDHKEAHHV